MLVAKATLHARMTPFAETSRHGCVKRSAGTAKIFMGVRIHALEKSTFSSYSLTPHLLWRAYSCIA